MPVMAVNEKQRNSKRYTHHGRRERRIFTFTREWSNIDSLDLPSAASDLLGAPDE
jgi:hypothetical protein